MSLTCNELITEIKDLLGRSGDNALITDDRVLRWLNDAQREITKQCPGLHSLYIKNTTSVDTTQTLRWALADWTSSISTPSGTSDVTTESRICHIYNLYYVDGNQSQKLNYLPVDEFDENVIDPTSTDYAQWSKPNKYTRRGNYLEIYPLCATSYCDKDLRLDAGVYPRDFTITSSSQKSVLEDVDEGFVSYCCYKASSYIGGSSGDSDATKWWLVFSDWLEKYRNKNDIMYEWEATLYPET